MLVSETGIIFVLSTYKCINPYLEAFIFAHYSQC